MESLVAVIKETPLPSQHAGVRGHLDAAVAAACGIGGGAKRRVQPAGCGGSVGTAAGALGLGAGHQITFMVVGDALLAAKRRSCDQTVMRSYAAAARTAGGLAALAPALRFARQWDAREYRRRGHVVGQLLADAALLRRACTGGGLASPALLASAAVACASRRRRPEQRGLRPAAQVVWRSASRATYPCPPSPACPPPTSTPLGRRREWVAALRDLDAAAGAGVAVGCLRLDMDSARRAHLQTIQVRLGGWVSWEWAGDLRWLRSAVACIRERVRRRKGWTGAAGLARCTAVAAWRGARPARRVCGHMHPCGHRARAWRRACVLHRRARWASCTAS